MDLSPSPITRTCQAVALLIDGENLSSVLAPAALTAARRLGPVATQRVYGDARNLGGWHEVPGLRVLHAHAGKNVTDMLLTIEAMDLSYSGRIDGFALASADRDFAPLAQALRSRGFPVLGLLGGQVSAMFAASCTQTLCLVPPAPAAPINPPAPAKAPAPAESLEAFALALLSKGPVGTADFARALQDKGFKRPANSATWSRWAQKTFPTLAIDGDGHSRRMTLPAARPRPQG